MRRSLRLFQVEAGGCLRLLGKGGKVEALWDIHTYAKLNAQLRNMLRHGLLKGGLQRLCN